MLDYLRLFAAVTLFAIGCYLLVDLVSHGLDLAVLLGSMLSFVLAHYVRPKTAARDAADAWGLLDIVDLIVDIPFRAIAFCLRAIAAARARAVSISTDGEPAPARATRRYTGLATMK